MGSKEGTTIYDVAVVGGGVFGTSAALHAARGGHRTILLEQFQLPHSRGSSAGQSRITRLSNFGTRAMTPIMRDSYDRWKELEKESDTELFLPTPLLTVGPAKTIKKMATEMKESGARFELPTLQEVNRRFRINPPGDTTALVDLTGGILMSAKCITALRSMFEAAGGQVLDLWPVRGIEPGPVVTIKGDKGEIRAKAVILCMGPWTTKALTGLGVQVPIWAGKTAALFWKIKDPKLPSFSFVDISVQNAYYYMLPSIEYPGYLKIGLHASKEVDPDNREFVDVSFLREKVTKYIKKVFPGVDPKCAIEEWCIYQRTPDEEMVVDHLPNHRNIVYASGFSGMGFKVAPTVGEALYRMALNLPPKFDLSFFSPKRFQARSKM